MSKCKPKLQFHAGQTTLILPANLRNLRIIDQRDSHEISRFKRGTKGALLRVRKK